VNTPGYTLAGCTPTGNGYCLFSANNTTPTIIVVNSTTLTSDVSYLALSVNCPISGGNCAYANAALTGQERQITITNHGSIPRNLSVVPSGLPTETIISNSTCSGTLDPGSSCSITIKPGQEASSICTTGIAPTNGTVTVSSDDALSIVMDVVVLSYGCQYQSGFLYSVDDSHPELNSIGGKVVTLTDQPTSLDVFLWSSNALAMEYDGGVSIYGISQISMINSANPYVGDSHETVRVDGQVPCLGNSDGACDSNNILAYYQGVDLSYYAAGICKAIRVGDYSDWYLPAICEMGYDSIPNGSGCGSLVSPTLQNMQSNLVNNHIPGSPNEDYWSSTENSEDPVSGVWRQYFNSEGHEEQGVVGKDDSKKVRCSRALTF
jgi:hypothetical protein